MPFLAYHKVDNRFELGVTTVKPEMFFKQIGGLKERGYEISPPTLPADRNQKGVCLTFDDGYDCFYRNVAPFLSSLGAKATVFVITDFIGRSNDWDIRLSYRPFVHMDKSQLREIAGQGFEVGSHTCTHRDLTRLDRIEVSNELVTSKKRIEDMLGKEVKTISFPFGRHNSEVVALARGVGYELLYGLGTSVGNGVIARMPVYRFDSAAAVQRKVALNRLEIAKGDLVHSLAYVSALLSVRHAGKAVRDYR